MRWIWVVAVAFACKSPHATTGDDAPTPPPLDAGDAPPAGDEAPASGTRLKLTWIDFDGTRTRFRIYDSELARACTAETWVDGEDYCTPIDNAAVAFEYEDDQCTKLVMPEETPPGALVFTLAASSATPCLPTAISGMHQVLEETTRAQIYETDGVTCHVRDPIPFFPLVRRTVPIPQSSFAHLVHTRGSAPTRLVPQWITSSDGLRLPDGFFDRELAAECSFEVGDNRLAGRCMPANHHTAGGFLDPDCQMPATFNTCPAPWFALPRIDLSTTCAVTQPTVHGQGSVVERFFQKPTPTSSCREVAIGPSQIVYALGPALDLVQSERSYDPAGPRITHVRHQTASGVLVDPERLFDHQLGIECFATPADIIGMFRCLPFHRGAMERGFSDANCQTPMVSVEVDQGPTSCPVPVPQTYVSAGTNFSARVEGVYTEPFYVKTFTCVARSQGAFTVRYRATEVDSSMFAAGVLATE